MKRFFLHIILFIPVAALAVILLLWLLGGTGKLRNVEYHLGHNDHSYTRLRQAAVFGRTDVLFIGSSHAYRTFDPRYYPNLRVFNLGSSNQTPVQSEALLHRFLDTLMPRLVVFEVHPDIMSYDGVESSLYLLCNSTPSWSMVPVVLRSRNAKVMCTAVYAALHNTFSRQFATYDEPVDVRGHRYVDGGFVEREVEHYSPQPHESTAIRPLQSQCAALQRCVDYLKKQGVPCILLEVPDTKVLMCSYDNLAEFQAQIRCYGNFYFKSLDTLVDSLHFYDDTHLNQEGVMLYNTFVRDSIILPTLDSLNLKR